jgi:lipid II:glycine glycyltransferase (peptidoglycan interpeptide bridge formation enzyme)
VYFHFGKRAVYKYGASDRKYQELRPNNLVMWEAIKCCLRNGYRSFCFGRTEPANVGLRQYKKGWGTDEHIINYYKYDLMKNTFMDSYREISAFQKKVFSKMPLPVLNIFGSLLYKHMG